MSVCLCHVLSEVMTDRGARMEVERGHCVFPGEWFKSVCVCNLGLCSNRTADLGVRLEQQTDAAAPAVFTGDTACLDWDQ